MKGRTPKREKNRFAAELKAWRERMNMAQAEAAEHLGVPSVRTLQNWEIGRTRPVGMALAMMRAAIEH